MKKYLITIDYGYDTHGVIVNQDVMNRIIRSESVAIVGQGFYVEGLKTKDSWIFNRIPPNSLEVEGEDGRQIFIGKLSDSNISEVK
jgi:hypothetical protein